MTHCPSSSSTVAAVEAIGELVCSAGGCGTAADGGGACAASRLAAHHSGLPLEAAGRVRLDAAALLLAYTQEALVGGKGNNRSVAGSTDQR